MKLWACDDFDLVADYSARLQAAGGELRQETGSQRGRSRLRYAAVYDDLAVIEINGVLVKYAFESWEKSSRGFIETSMSALIRDLTILKDDPGVKRVLILIESPGGEVRGTYEAAAALRELSKVKPTTVFVDDLCTSGAYYFAAQAREIVANRAGWIGSIGIFGLLLDSSENFQRIGLRVIPVRSSELKGEGIPGVPVNDAQIAHYKRRVDSMFSLFKEAVQVGRKLNGDRLAKVTTAETWMAEDAMRLGLIDGISTVPDTLRKIGGLPKSALLAMEGKAETKPLEPQPESQETSYSPPKRMGLLRATGW